ncbi:MAG: hypothetical protein JWL75_726 [Parcubacteria group bacterium]|nr:hypothetical protein [Parcubacteria group bacterium]
MADSHGGGGPPLMSLAQGINHRIHSSGYHLTARPFITAFIVMNVAFLFLDPAQTFRNWVLLGYFAPIWVPALLFKYTFDQWVRAKRSEFIASQETVLLELRMPRDTKKTPLAIEAILSNIHITSGESTNYAKYWQGKVRTWFSLEIVSLGGRVHFYVWTRAGFRRGVEAAFYAQYPDMEIVEADDYSLTFDPGSHDNSMFAEEFIHTKPDAFPIKTYVDYALDKPGAEPEEIVDPLAQLIEFMAAIGPKEHLWLQMVIRATKDEKLGHKRNAAGDKYTWKDEAKDEIEKIRASTVRKTSYVDNVTGEVKEVDGFPNPTKGQSDTLNAIERNIAKQGFDVGMRTIYSAPKDAFHGATIPFILGPMLKPFSSEAYNGFKLGQKYDTMFNDYPWEDKGGHHKEHLHQLAVNNFRRRAFFHDPYVGEWMVMSTEELATLFHVPSAAVETPGLPRIQSSTSGAPANLPT